MNVKRWTLVTLVTAIALSTAVAVVFASREPGLRASAAANTFDAPQDELSQQAANGTYRWVYSVKFVCGYQPPLVDIPGQVSRGEPVVKPANYATEVNIHNYNFKPAELRKKLILLVQPSADGKEQRVIREPESTGPLTNAAGAVNWDKLALRNDFATMDDCNRFWRWMYPDAVPPTPFPLTIGYLVIYSSLDLDVDAVYTAAAPGPVSEKSQGISIDVERVAGKRVFVPANELP